MSFDCGEGVGVGAARVYAGGADVDVPLVRGLLAEQFRAGLPGPRWSPRGPATPPTGWGRTGWYGCPAPPPPSCSPRGAPGRGRSTAGWTGPRSSAASTPPSARPGTGRDSSPRCAVPSDGPCADRGFPLAARDAAVALTVWEEVLRPLARPRPVGHADLSPGGVLVRDGRLSTVVGFVAAGVKDPAVALIVGWPLLARARGVFRDGVDADEATWVRGRALSIALIRLPCHRPTGPAVAADARHVAAEGPRRASTPDPRAGRVFVPARWKAANAGRATANPPAVRVRAAGRPRGEQEEPWSTPPTRPRWRRR